MFTHCCHWYVWSAKCPWLFALASQLKLFNVANFDAVILPVKQKELILFRLKWTLIFAREILMWKMYSRSTDRGADIAKENSPSHLPTTTASWSQNVTWSGPRQALATLKRVKACEEKALLREEDPFSALVEQSNIVVGQEKFVILRQIGHGGFSTVRNLPIYLHTFEIFPISYLNLSGLYYFAFFSHSS